MNIPEIIQDLVKVAAAYVGLADQILSQVGDALPGVAHNREYAYQAGEKALEALKEGATFCTQLERETLDRIYKQCPDLKQHGIDNFDGYYCHFDEITGRVKDDPACANGCAESPLEFITQLIDDRDEWKRKADELLKFLSRAPMEGRIVASSDLNDMQIAESRRTGRFFVEHGGGLGWAILPWDLRTSREGQ